MKISTSVIITFLFMPFLRAQETQTEIKDQAVSLLVEGKTLKGSLTKAAGVKVIEHRVALLISGSGPTDRDGNSLPMMKNNSLKYVAHAITRSGVSTLRVDKRGVAASKEAGLKEKDLRFQTYVDDITSWIDLLVKQGYKEVILVGHSEGALVASMAAKHPSVIGVVSLAGAGRPAADLLKEQLKVNMPEAGVKLANGVIDQLEKGQLVGEVHLTMYSLFRPSVQPYLISWFAIDPAEEIAKLEMPVLIIQGATDLQIKEQDARLLHEAAKNSKLHIIKGMNYVLKEADGDRRKQLPSYLSQDLSLVENLVKEVTNFVRNLNEK